MEIVRFISISDVNRAHENIQVRLKNFVKTPV